MALDGRFSVWDPLRRALLVGVDDQLQILPGPQKLTGRDSLRVQTPRFLGAFLAFLVGFPGIFGWLF